jgi:hypothetical protein
MFVQQGGARFLLLLAFLASTITSPLAIRQGLDDDRSPAIRIPKQRVHLSVWRTKEVFALPGREGQVHVYCSRSDRTSCDGSVLRLRGGGARQKFRRKMNRNKSGNGGGFNGGGNQPQSDKRGQEQGDGGQQHQGWGQWQGGFDKMRGGGGGGGRGGRQGGNAKFEQAGRKNFGGPSHHGKGGMGVNHALFDQLSQMFGGGGGRRGSYVEEEDDDDDGSEEYDDSDMDGSEEDGVTDGSDAGSEYESDSGDYVYVDEDGNPIGGGAGRVTPPPGEVIPVCTQSDTPPSVQASWLLFARDIRRSSAKSLIRLCLDVSSFK